MTAPILTGLHRRSFCCLAPVAHPRPCNARPLRYALALACTACGRIIASFEVVNEHGERIWPVPDEEHAHKHSREDRFPAPEGPLYPIHLSSRVLSRILG